MRLRPDAYRSRDLAEADPAMLGEDPLEVIERLSGYAARLGRAGAARTTFHGSKIGCSAMRSRTQRK